MAGGFVALYTQDFTTTSSITVTHNLDRVVCAVRVLIGFEVRNDLVESIIPSAADPRNVIIVTLKASNSGVMQIIDSDYIWGSLPTPEGAAALENNISGSTFSGSFTGSFIGDGTALSITETDTLDDVTGRGNTTTNSITVNGITSNSNIVLTGALDATGDIDNAGTYNGIQHYTSSATDPTTPTPSDGDRYYNTALDMEMRYDSTRAKWLSVESSVMEFGRDGNTGGGSYYRGPGGRAYASNRGRTAEFDGTVVSISYSRNDQDAATFEVTADGTGVATLASSVRNGKDVTLNGNFTADQVLAIKNQTGSNTTRHVLGWVRIRWRA